MIGQGAISRLKSFLLLVDQAFHNESMNVCHEVVYKKELLIKRFFQT